MEFRFYFATALIILLVGQTTEAVTNTQKRIPAIQPGTNYQQPMKAPSNRSLSIMPGMGGMNPMQMGGMSGMGGMGGMNPMQQMGGMNPMQMGGMNPMQQMGGMGPMQMGGMGPMQKNWSWGQNPQNANFRKPVTHSYK